MQHDDPRITVDPRFKGLEDAAALEALGDRLFSGDPMGRQQDPPPHHPAAAPQVSQMGSEVDAGKRDALHQARQHASKARRSIMSEAVLRAERDVELKRMEEEMEAEDRRRVVDEHAQLRSSLHDDARKQRIDDTTKRALKQLQQLSDFLNLDKADPQLERVATLSATGPPLSLDKEIQRRMVPHQLRPSEMFRSNLRAMDHLMEAVAAIQAPTIAQLEDEERELMLEAAQDAEATKILMAQCTCAARLDNAIRSAETAAAIKARMECTHLFAKMTVAAANMIRSLEILVSEKDTYIDDVTASNQMLVKKYDALLDDFYVMERDTTQRLKELEEELKKPIGGGGGKGNALHVAAAAATNGSSGKTPRGGAVNAPPVVLASPPTKASSHAVALGKHSVVLKQREYLEREGRVLQRYREMFEVRPDDNPCPAGASGLQCSSTPPPPPHQQMVSHNGSNLGGGGGSIRSNTNNTTTASFRLPHDDVAAVTHHNTSQQQQMLGASGGNFNDVLAETFRLDAHIKPEEKTTSAEWVQRMLKRVQRFQQQKQHSRDLEKALMAMHDVAEPPASTHRAMQTMKEEDVVGSPAWDKKYSAMREAAERASRPALQDEPQTREMFHTDFMIKQELRKCGVDAVHGIPQRIIGPLEAVMGAIKDMLVSVDYARVTTVQQLSRDVKDEARAMQRCNRLQAELEDELEDGLDNLRRGLASFKGSVIESLRPVMLSSSSTVGSPNSTNESAVFGCSNVELLARLSNRFATWAKDVLHVQLPDLSAFGGDTDGPPDPMRQSIRSLDILLDMMSELGPSAAGTAVGPAVGRSSPHGKSKKRSNATDDDDPEESEEQATRSMIGSAVGIAVFDATELIQSIRAAVPITLPPNVQDALGTPPPEVWREWGSVVSHLRTLSEWCKATGTGVEKFRREAAAAKILQQVEKERTELPPMLATPRKSAAASPTAAAASLTDEANLSKSKRAKPKSAAGEDASPTKKTTSKSGGGSSRASGSMGQSIRHTTSPKEDVMLSTAAGDAADEPPAPSGAPQQESLWEEKENPLTANVQMLAMSIRDIIFRLTQAISKTQYKAAKIPSATMREVLLLDKELAEEQSQTAALWSTEKLAVLIGRVVDWSDMIGDIIALPYERSASDNELGIRNLDEEAAEAAQVVRQVPSVYVLREKHKRSLSGESGEGDATSSSGHVSSQVSQRAAGADTIGGEAVRQPTEQMQVGGAAARRSVSPSSVSFNAAPTTPSETVGGNANGNAASNNGNGGGASWSTAGDVVNALASTTQSTHCDRSVAASRTPSGITRSPVPQSFVAREPSFSRHNDFETSDAVAAQPSTDWIPLQAMPDHAASHQLQDDDGADGAAQSDPEHLRFHPPEAAVAPSSSSATAANSQRPELSQPTFMDAILDATASSSTRVDEGVVHAEAATIAVATVLTSAASTALPDNDEAATTTTTPVAPLAQSNGLSLPAADRCGTDDGGPPETAPPQQPPQEPHQVGSVRGAATSSSSPANADVAPAKCKDGGASGSASAIQIPTANPRRESGSISGQPETAQLGRRTVSPKDTQRVAPTGVDGGMQSTAMVVSSDRASSTSTTKQHHHRAVESVESVFALPARTAAKANASMPSAGVVADATRSTHNESPTPVVVMAAAERSGGVAPPPLPKASPTAQEQPATVDPFGAFVAYQQLPKDAAAAPPPDAMDDEMDAEEEEARRAKDAAEEAKQIESAVMALYPDLAQEINTSKVSDSVMRQRSVVANRKSTAQTIQAVHNMCAEVVEVLQLDDTLNYALRKQLDTGEGNFTKLADHIQNSMRKRRSTVQVVENAKLDALETEALRAAYLQEQLEDAMRELEVAKEELETERVAWGEERAQLLLRPPVTASPSDESFLPTPIRQHRETTQLDISSSRIDMEGQTNSTRAQSAVGPAPVGGPTTALEALSNLRQSHKYQIALDRSAQVSAMIVGCMQRLVLELSPAERTALTYELVGESVVALHKTLVPLFSTQLFRRLHVLSHVPLPQDPLDPFLHAQNPPPTDVPCDGTAAGDGGADAKTTSGRRKKSSVVSVSQPPPRKLLPNVAQLLDFDFRIVNGVYEVLSADSASVVAKLKNTFEHVRTRVMLRKAQQQSERRRAASTSQQSLALRQTEGISYQSQKEAAFLQKREAALAEEVERLERQREAIEAQRARQASALGGRWWAARAQPLPMHPVLLFLTENDSDATHSPGGLVAGSTDASAEYMEEFRARVAKWFAHSHASSIHKHDRGFDGFDGSGGIDGTATATASPGTTWGASTLRTAAARLSPAAEEGVDVADGGPVDNRGVESEDAWKYRTPENYIQKLIPVKAVDLQVDRELGRRRLLAGHTLVKAPSKHIYGPGAGTTVKNIMLQQLQQRVVEHVVPPTATTATATATTPPPTPQQQHHQAAASPSASPTALSAPPTMRSLGRPLLPPLAASAQSSASSPAHDVGHSQQQYVASPVMVDSPSMPRSTTFSSGRASLATPPPGPWDQHGVFGGSSSSVLVPTLGNTIASSSALGGAPTAASAMRRLPMKKAQQRLQ